MAKDMGTDMGNPLAIRQVDGQVEGWTVRQTDGQTDGWTDRWTDGGPYGQMDAQVETRIGSRTDTQN